MLLLSLQGLQCITDNHPDAEELKEQRIRFYFLISILSQQCLGSRIYSLKTYLIIDNATSADAGTYVVEMTSGLLNSITLQLNISVVVGMSYTSHSVYACVICKCMCLHITTHALYITATHSYILHITQLHIASYIYNYIHA